MSNNLRYLLATICLYVASVFGASECVLSQNNTRSAYSFDLQASVLILKPGSTSINYAAEATPLPLVSPHWNIFDIQPHYHVGFDLGLNLMFHERDTNLLLNWEHFKSSSSALQQVSSQNMIGPFFEIGPDAEPYKNAAGEVHFRFDEVHLRYGQLVDIGCYSHANIFAGVSFVRIEQNLLSTYANESGNAVRTITTPSKFTGAGPEVGVDFSYCIIDTMSLVGKTAVTLLAGKINNNTIYSSTSPLLAPLGATSPNIQTTTVGKRSQIIPGFEERIGFSYAHSSYCGNYWLQLEVGYQAQIYINAIQSVDMSSQVVTPPVASSTIGVFARTFHKTVSNFSLGGPYVSFSVGF